MDEMSNQHKASKRHCCTSGARIYIVNNKLAELDCCRSELENSLKMMLPNDVMFGLLEQLKATQEKESDVVKQRQVNKYILQII